jgi:putative transposase
VFAADINHQVSKRIVAEAQRTGRGIAVEERAGIRARVRLRKPQRAALHSWAFAQLGTFLGYTAQAAEVAFVEVDPPTRRRRAARVAGWTNGTAARRARLSVAAVASLGTRITTQRA